MKKDYTTVPVEDQAVDETDLITRTWTRTWSGISTPADPGAVARREEYQLMRPFLARLPVGARLLDGGCGLGEWTVFFSRQGYEVTGVDLSVATIARLQEAFPLSRFVAGDIRNTGLPAGSFDGYFSWGTFEHFELGMERPLVEAYRVLRPGGLLFASVPFQNWRHILRDQGPLATWDESFHPVEGYAQPQRFYQYRFTREEFRRELELRGFRVLSVRPFGKRHGVNRWLQWEGALFSRTRLTAALARRMFTVLFPAGYIAHQVWAVAERRPDR